MSRPVYLTGFGHYSAAGTTLDTACNAIVAGDVHCTSRNIAGKTLPFYAFAHADAASSAAGTPTAAAWYLRAQEIICSVGAEIRADCDITDSEWSQAEFFFASSSFQIGALELAARSGHTEFPPAAEFAAKAANWLGMSTAPWCFATACTSSLSALDAAATLIRAGVLRRALVLGVELPNHTSLAGFSALDLLSPTACRPLDQQRDGLVLGEAVAAVWLADQPCGGRWGDWRVAGIDAALDSHSATGPNPDGVLIAEVMTKALHRAGLTADDIDLVKLQAAGSPAVDLAEGAALRRVFGERAPALVSLKSFFGHTLGASGAAELSALVGCLARDIVPATVGFLEVDPAIGLAPTTDAHSTRVQRVLFNLIGFGGSVVSLVIEQSS
jgi:3-oxoacyl-[acyl-carrier-protein] synthase-1